MLFRSGFSGWDGDGKPVVLTAGHCSKIINEETNDFDGDTTVDQTEKPSISQANGGEGFQASGNGVIGKWGFANFGGDLLEGADSDKWPEPSASDIDFAVINVDESKYNVKNGITDWSTADSDDLAKSTTEIYTLSLHDALPISLVCSLMIFEQCPAVRTTGLPSPSQPEKPVEQAPPPSPALTR